MTKSSCQRLTWVPFDQAHEGEDDGQCLLSFNHVTKTFHSCVVLLVRGGFSSNSDPSFVICVFPISIHLCIFFKTDEDPMLPGSFDHQHHKAGGKQRRHRRQMATEEEEEAGGQRQQQWSAKVKRFLDGCPTFFVSSFLLLLN